MSWPSCARVHDRTATIVALEVGSTLVLSREDFVALRRDHPGVEQLLVETLARRVDELSQALLEALYVGVDRRVIRRLVDLADAYEVPASEHRDDPDHPGRPGRHGRARPGRR